jgi:hypothetical protein
MDVYTLDLNQYLSAQPITLGRASTPSTADMQQHPGATTFSLASLIVQIKRDTPSFGQQT